MHERDRQRDEQTDTARQHRRAIHSVAWQIRLLKYLMINSNA